MPTLKKKKIKSSKHVKATKHAKTSGSDKIEGFVSSLDLQEMWEKFAHSFNENGTPKYKTVWSFISSYTKDVKKRDILYWLLGPKVDIQTGQTPKYSIDQYDWEEKRQQGFWFSSSNVKNLKDDIHRKASAYEAIREAGKVNVDFIAMLNNLLKQLEDEFGGRLFLPQLKVAENTLRAQLYMQLLKQIMDLSSQAQLMYAKTQGMDLERLDQFFQLFGNAMGRTAATLMGQQSSGELDNGAPGGGHHLTSQFAKVVEMVATKSQEYSMPLPDNIAQAIKETSEPKKASKKVN